MMKLKKNYFTLEFYKEKRPLDSLKSKVTKKKF